MKGCGTVIGRGSAFIVVMTLAGGDASAQDLDRDKPAAKLFAANCAGCQGSPRGLVKGRFSWSLSSFLQQHYTSSAATARDLAAYLQAADAQRGKAPPSARKKSRPPDRRQRRQIRRPQRQVRRPKGCARQRRCRRERGDEMTTLPRC
jgi:hypothetical protein